MNMNPISNPVFTTTDAAEPGSPWVNTVYTTAEEPSVEVEAIITFPDAGDLFAPMHAQLAASAPEHIMQKFQELPRYDGNLHLPCMTSTCNLWDCGWTAVEGTSVGTAEF